VEDETEDRPPMNFWQWLHDLGPGWPDGRGWVGVATTSLTVMVLWMMAERKDLREDEFFQVIATAIILTGMVQGVIGWAYSATKTGGELADSNARIAEQAATTQAITDRRIGDRKSPLPVRIEEQKKPVEVTETPHSDDDEEDAAPRPRR
jgi:hypothetical protein